MNMNIDVQKKTDAGYIVSVIPENGLITQHTVLLHPKYYQMLTGGKISEKDLIIASFKFLLSKESNEAILPDFELPDISQYFPEYEKEIKKQFN